MKAKIIQYNPASGIGIAISEGCQYEFSIKHWKSEVPPSIGQSIELIIENGNVIAVLFVAKTNFLNINLDEALTPKNIDQFTNNFINYFGKGALISYLIFVVSTIYWDAISLKTFIKIGIPLWDISEALDFLRAAVIIKFLFIISFLSIPVAYYQKDKNSWYLLYVPLISIIYTTIFLGFISISNIYKVMNNFTHFSFEMGYFVSTLSSISLAFFCYQKSK